MTIHAFDEERSPCCLGERGLAELQLHPSFAFAARNDPCMHIVSKVQVAYATRRESILSHDVVYLDAASSFHLPGFSNTHTLGCITCTGSKVLAGCTAMSYHDGGGCGIFQSATDVCISIPQPKHTTMWTKENHREMAHRWSREWRRRDR